ncbi:MAG: aspartate aminotransferase family protein [Sumerlaeia bacterium]
MTASLLERKRRVMMPCLYHFYGDNPLELVRGQGMTVWDREGRQYLDFFAGVAVNSLGHCHPEVTAAASAQMNSLQHTTSIYLSELPIALAEDLVRLAPEPISRVFFCADGSGANEGALVAARIATGRPGFLAFRPGLHGRTSLTLAATGVAMWRADPFPPPVVQFVEHPALQPIEEHFAALEDVIQTTGAERFAAFIAEPICGNGGILVPPPAYFRRLKDLLNRHGILLIADEVQTGFGRTGRWFGMEHWDVSPDLMSVAKALGNGLPVAAWLATEEVARAVTSPQASTFGGNLVAMAAARKVIEVIERANLTSAAEAKGRFFRALLATVNDPRIAEVRGKGLMIGVELRQEDGSPDPTLCDALLMRLRHCGILAGKTGAHRNVLTFEPPLIVTEAQMEYAVSQVSEALALDCSPLAGSR